MAALNHGPNQTDEVEHPDVVTRNTRYGLVLFAVYLVFYSGYVLVNAFAPRVMEWKPLAGVNLAVLSGFGLIILALLLAVIYGWLCRNGNGSGLNHDSVTTGTDTDGKEPQT